MYSCTFPGKQQSETGFCWCGCKNELEILYVGTAFGYKIENLYPWNESGRHTIDTGLRVICINTQALKTPSACHFIYSLFLLFSMSNCHNSAQIWTEFIFWVVAKKLQNVLTNAQVPFVVTSIRSSRCCNESVKLVTNTCSFVSTGI